MGRFTLLVVCIGCRCPGVCSRGLQSWHLWEMAGPVPCWMQVVSGSSSKPAAGYTWAPQPQAKVVAHQDKHIWERGKHCAAVRDGGKCVRKSPVDTKVRKEGRESAPNAGASIPLQPLEGAKVVQLFPWTPWWSMLDVFCRTAACGQDPYWCKQNIWGGRSRRLLLTPILIPHSARSVHIEGDGGLGKEIAKLGLEKGSGKGVVLLLFLYLTVLIGNKFSPGQFLWWHIHVMMRSCGRQSSSV